MSDRKEYLGDGVYVDFDGYHLVLTTKNGISVTNRIYLDGWVYAALVQYAARLRSGAAPDGQDEAARIDAACRQWHAGHVISVQRGEQHCRKACPHCGGICSTAISPPRPEAAHD